MEELMDVLLSVKPEFANLIFNGTKQYEYRRNMFCERNINRVMVYASSPVKKIVGEFQIEDILYDDINTLWTNTRNKSGISKKYFLQYFSNKSMGYAIKISTIRSYDIPLHLNSINVSTPPQSFMYLDRNI